MSNRMELPKRKPTRLKGYDYSDIESHYPNIIIDKYVIMPDHIHMIIVISETERINPFPTIKYDIPNVVGKFKGE